MQFHRAVAVLFVFAFSSASALKTETELDANPVRRIVTMLQMMQNKVKAEAEKRLELFDKFMCYCETSSAELAKSIEEAQDKIPQLESEIKTATEQKAQMEGELVNHKSNREDANEAIEKATAIRKKEANVFGQDSGETKANIDSLGKAVAAISKGLGESFLQTPAASVLRQLSLTQDLSTTDRDMLSAFLSQKQGDSDPGSNEILGMLKQMKEDMEKDLAELIAQEEASDSDFQGLVAAKKKEIAADTHAIETKTARVGELEVKITTLKHDLEDTSESLAEDEKMLVALKKDCAAKKTEHEAAEKMTSQELVALADTIKMLNDDDALELFKKTVPSAAASFIQLKQTPQQVREDALRVIKQAKRRGVHGVPLDFIALALRGKNAGFEKVIKMIDDMVVILGKDQKEDDKKKEYCAVEFDKSEDTIKVLQKETDDAGKVLAEQMDILGNTNEEIAALEAGIAELDKSVAQATETRKQEHAEYTNNLAANNAAKELIEMAKNRMNKFYNPKLYKPPPKRELSEEERITLNMGGTLAPTEPPGGIAGTGISFAQLKAKTDIEDDDDMDDDAPAPWDRQGADQLLQKQKEAGAGVIAMMDGIKNDLEAEITEMKMDEKHAQEDYVELMADAAEKRATDSKAVTAKEGGKAELEDEMQKAKDGKKATDGELAEANKYLAELHQDCDFLVEHYEERKEARTNELDALGKAKAVLSGADYSFLQTSQKKQLRAVNRRYCED